MRLIKVAVAISLMLLLTSSPIIYSQYDLGEQSVSGYVEIFTKHSGIVEVYLYINYLSEPPAILIELPMEPVTYNIDIVSGNASQAIYAGGGYALIMITTPNGSVTLRYEALLDITNSTAIASVRSPPWASYTKIYLMRDLIGNMFQGNPINLSGLNGEAYIEEGYLVYKLPPNSSIEIPLHITNKGGTSYAVLAIATGAPLAIIATMIIRRSYKRSSPEELDAIDKEILRIVRSFGGETSMSRVMDRTGIPRTTLWRRVKKLSKLGYVEIEKIGRSSVIRLRKPRSI